MKMPPVTLTSARKQSQSKVVIYLFTIAVFIGLSLYFNKLEAIQIYLLNNPLIIIKPTALVQYSQNSFQYLLIMSGVIIAHNVFWACVMYLLSFYLVQNIVLKLAVFKSKSDKSKGGTARSRPSGYMDCGSAAAPIQILKTKADMNDPNDIDPAPWDEAYMNLPYTVSPSIQAMTPTQALTKELYDLLTSSPDVPASIGTHHGDTTLLKHSVTVTQKLITLANENGVIDPLLEPIGLGHDIDKLIAYEKKGDTWEKKATHHHTFAAHIVRNLPSFKSLSDDDRKVLNYTLKYYHHPEELPTDSTERTMTLINLIRNADGKSTSFEQSEAGSSVVSDEYSTQLRDAIIKGIKNMDVNQYKGSQRPWGWTSDAYEFLAVTCEDIMTVATPFLSPEIQREIRTDIAYRSLQNHPSITPILDALTGAGLLMLDYKQTHSDEGTFVIKAGAKKFNCVLLLDKERLNNIMPEIVCQWGNSPYSKFKVLDAWVKPR